MFLNSHKTTRDAKLSHSSSKTCHALSICDLTQGKGWHAFLVQAENHDEDARDAGWSILGCTILLVPVHICGVHVHPHCLWLCHQPQVLPAHRLWISVCILLHLGQHIGRVCILGEYHEHGQLVSKIYIFSISYIVILDQSALITGPSVVLHHDSQK